MPPMAPPMDPATYQELMEQQRKWLEMTAAASGTDIMALQVMFQNPVILQQQQYMWEQMAQQQVCVCVCLCVKCECLTIRCVCLCVKCDWFSKNTGSVCVCVYERERERERAISSIQNPSTGTGLSSCCVR